MINRKIAVSIVIFLLIASSLFGNSLLLFTPLVPVAASEEENIDSFDVSPKSGRWNVTSDTFTDSNVIDSELHLTTVNNQSSGSAAYNMDRNLEKTDGKVEFRAKADGGGNQTEYFRDIVGDSADFNDGDYDGFTGGSGCDVSLGDGVVNLVGTGAGTYYSWGNYQIDPDINVNIFHTVEYKIWVDRSGLSTYFKMYQDGVKYTYTSLELTKGWNVVSWDVYTGYTMIESFFALYVLYSELNYVVSAIDYIKIFGDLDYATHVEGEVEDTWDWEDSDEYFYDEESNISDFNDGTTELWQLKTGGANFANDNGWLEFDTFAVGDVSINLTTPVAIDSSVYKWFTMEYSYYTFTGSFVDFTIKDSGGNQIYFDNTDAGSTIKTLISGNLDDDADWAGTETDLELIWEFSGAVDAQVSLNFTFLYDVGLGDLEVTGGLMDREYVNPNGWWVGECAAGSNDYWRSPSTAQVISTEFDLLKIRIKSLSDTRGRLRIKYDDDTYSYPNDGYITLPAGEWVDIEKDISDDSTYKSHEYSKYLYFYIYDDSGDLEGTEIILIDYISFLGEWTDSDSTIGLFDDQTDTPLVNVSIHHTNTSNYMDVELLDSMGEIAYNYSTNATLNPLNDVWLVGKLEYDVLRSRFKLQITFDNGTRLFKIEYPEDFTIQSGMIPALFSLGRSPAIYISTYSQSLSWQSFIIDWIKADYTEQRWNAVDIATDPYWVENTWDSLLVEGDTDAESSNFSLNVPFFDAASGSLTANFSGDLGTMEWSSIGFGVWGIDANDGEKHEIVMILLQIANTHISDSGADYIRARVFIDGWSTVVYDHVVSYTAVEQPRVDFTIGTSQSRQQISLKGRFYPDEKDKTSFTDIFWTGLLSDYVDDPSQEFLLESTYSVQFSTGDKCLLSIQNFDLLERDIWADIAKAVIDPITSFLGGIFATIGKFLAGIFKFVGDLIGAVISAAIFVMQVALEVAIGAVEAAVGLVETAIVTMQTALEGAIGLVETAVDLVTAAVDVVKDVVDDVLAELLLIAADVIDELANQIGSVLDAAIAWVLSVAQDAADMLFAIIEFLIDLLLTIAAELWSLLETVAFWIWDTLSLPDLLSIIELLFDFLAELVVYAIDFVISAIDWFLWMIDMWAMYGWVTYCVIWAFIVLVPAFFANDPMDWIDKMWRRLGWNVSPGKIDLLGFTVLPGNIPIAFILIPATYFGLTGGFFW